MRRACFCFLIRFATFLALKLSMTGRFAYVFCWFSLLAFELFRLSLIWMDEMLWFIRELFSVLLLVICIICLTASLSTFDASKADVVLPTS